MRSLGTLRQWARELKRDVVTVYFAARDPRTPRSVRWLALAVTAYALSPIDLIPDFIPVLGYLDDLLLVPLGLALVIRWIPADVMQTAREKAAVMLAKPRSYLTGLFFVCLWVAAASTIAWYLLPYLRAGSAG